MPPRSNVEKMSPELRSKLHTLLDDPTVTRLQIAAIINNEAGEAIISASGINRYALKWAELTERSRRAREAATIWQEKLGSDTSNVLGRVINEQLRVLLFDLTGLVDEMKDAEGEDAIKDAVDSLYKVTRALKALEESDRINADRAQAIREQTLKDAADAVVKGAKSHGLSEKTAQDFRRIVLGLKDG